MEAASLRDIRFLLKPQYKSSHALIVGINQYSKASPLSYAVSDAQEFRDTLVEHFDFSPDNITTLFNREATKEAILRRFMRFTNNDIDLDDRIIIFFAGHGNTRTGIRGEVGYLVPHDADLQDFSTFIRWDDLTRNAELVRAKHMLFIMDACYGGLALTRHARPGSTRFLNDMMIRYSRQVLTAGKGDELVSDSGGPLPNHSVFTGHLIEGLQGKAATEDGIITASGLMAYVYGRVANDKNSNQTPHFGHFDGDGDLIFKIPQNEEAGEDREKVLDRLLVIPFPEEDSPAAQTPDKIKKVKSLLANDSSSIELHDFLAEEVRRVLSLTSEDHFEATGSFSQEELLRRMSRYEEIASDLALLSACLAYWAKPNHKTILQKIFARATDRLESRPGLVIWNGLSWYPLIISLYYSGIAAVEGKRYDSLANILYTTVGSPQPSQKHDYLAETIGNIILELNQEKTFSRLPGYDRYYAPMSEHLHKILQPKLDDILFIGKNYDRSFDEFEVLFALVVVDIRIQQDEGPWTPIGRFGWKNSTRTKNTPLKRMTDEASTAGEDWPPLKAGLFAGKIERFTAAAEGLSRVVSGLGWF